MKPGKDYIGVSVGAVIYNNEGKVFMALRGEEVRNEPGLWEFPGGGLEFMEEFEDALQRELMEECGVEIEIVETIAIGNNIIKKENQHWVAPSFLCRITHGIPEIKEPHKCKDIGWFSIQEIQSMPITEVCQSELANLLKQKDRLKSYISF